MAAFNPFAPEFKADPYPVYADLRRDQPVARTEPLGFYAVSRYDDVSYVLKNPQLFSSAAMGRRHDARRRPGDDARRHRDQQRPSRPYAPA